MSSGDTGTLPRIRIDTEDPDDLDALDDLDFDPDAAADPAPRRPAPAVVVFDIGEVLIDESRVWACWADILGVSSLTFAAVLGAAVVQGEDHEAVFPHVAPNVDWRDFLDEHERRYGGFREEDLYTDARLCLQELRDLGVGVAIAGNQPRRRLEQLRALRLPAQWIATSADLGADKPDPAFFDAVRELVGVTSAGQMLYVGDRVDNDVVPAIEAGMQTCWLRRGPWGQLQDLPDGVEPDLVLDGLGELPLLLTAADDEEQP